MSEKILFVDDDPCVLSAHQRALRKGFAIDTACGAEAGLAAIRASGPYAVIVSDLKMPRMNGIDFLVEVQRRAPDSVRMLLTGGADLETAIQAVNEGNVFRFLTKPCPSDLMAAALRSGLEQHRLVTAEKELLSRTLRGVIKLLVEVLSLTSPTAFGRAMRVQRMVRRICDRLGLEQQWQIEVAAMLSQLGCVTIPQDTLDKIYRGQGLGQAEREMFADHPRIARDLIANIPRLEETAEIVFHQQRRFDDGGRPPDGIAGQEIPLGARILKAALDYDSLQSTGSTDAQAIAQMRAQASAYDPNVFAALEAAVGVDEAFELREVRLRELAPHMLLAADVRTIDGTLVVAKGQEVTPSLYQRLKNFASRRPLIEPIRVLMRTARSPVAAGPL
jgi:response regulator RpfG family c-di-GMP phosphodiesterase